MTYQEKALEYIGNQGNQYLISSKAAITAFSAWLDSIDKQPECEQPDCIRHGGHSGDHWFGAELKPQLKIEPLIVDTRHNIYLDHVAYIVQIQEKINEIIHAYAKD